MKGTTQGRRGLALSLLLTAGFVALNLVVARLLSARGIQPTTGLDTAIVASLMETGSYPPTVHYPPGVPLLQFLVVGVVGLPETAMWVLRALMMAGGLLSLAGLTRLYSSTWYLPALVVSLTLANPYFVWTGLASRDFAASFGLMMAGLYLILRMARRPAGGAAHLLLAAGGAVLGSLAFLVRITILFEVSALLIVLYFLYRQRRRELLLAGSVFAVFVVGFLAHNYRLMGRVLLSSETYPLVQGNHPGYLNCHPKYDVDGCFDGEIGAYLLRQGDVGELAASDALRDLALRYITSDPLAFIYRALVKSAWHWFNLEKIPNYTAIAEWDSSTRSLIVRSDIQIPYSLAYALYKIVYLPLFVASLITFVRKRKWEWAPFYLPYFVLWPIVILTFPDTRYKMAAEVLSILPMMLFLEEAVRDWRRSRSPAGQAEAAA